MKIRNVWSTYTLCAVGRCVFCCEAGVEHTSQYVAEWPGDGYKNEQKK